MSQPPGPGPAAPAAARILAGVLRLARFRRDGLDCFVATPQAFLNSLAPMLAFPLAFSLPALIAGAGMQAVTELLATLVTLLAPAVLTHALARRWHREPLWLRMAVALNWMQAAFTVAMILLLYAGLRLGGDLAEPAPPPLLLPALAAVCYWLALIWFLFRRGLELTRLRATIAVVAVNLITGLLLLLPQAIANLARTGGVP